MTRSTNFTIGDPRCSPENEKILEAVEENPAMLENEDTTCGFWVFKGPFLQRFANKKAYVIMFGLLGCLNAASSAYFTGILSTVEKRFGIPSKVSGFITVGNDISSLIVTPLLTYYASKKHQPRWIGFGMYTIVVFCILSGLPHFLYGPGNNALSLTEEFSGSIIASNTSYKEHLKNPLCDNTTKPCETADGHVVAPIILFVAQFISGLGGSLYHTLGVSYMDDNVKRSRTPMLLSLTYFIRSLGPVLGYFVSSLTLKLFIAPTLTPTISNKDPRWLGAWWLGWIMFAILIFILSTLVTMFPKIMPKAALRKKSLALSQENGEQVQSEIISFTDMLKTFKRLFSNGILMCNNLAGIFYILGAMPYFIFLPKYIEIMFAQSASKASLITGTVGLVFSSLGILLSGYVLGKFQPRARSMAAWNVFVGILMVIKVVAFGFLECSELAGKNTFYSFNGLYANATCNNDCHCDYVKYSPVCSEYKQINFISPCHAGCKVELNEKKFGNCSCVETLAMDTFEGPGRLPHTVTAGQCPVDCQSAFVLFLVIVCVIQFISATGKTTNVLVAVRCVADKDKSVSIGIGITLMSLAAFIPSPILFGHIIDKSCLVWGKTCSSRSHCWLYDSEKLRHTMNFTSAAFIAIGVLFDTGVWYLAKDIQIFEEEIPSKSRSKDKSNDQNGQNMKTISS